VPGSESEARRTAFPRDGMRTGRATAAHPKEKRVSQASQNPRNGWLRRVAPIAGGIVIGVAAMAFPLFSVVVALAALVWIWRSLSAPTVAR
jgi:hypothetical protein